MKTVFFPAQAHDLSACMGLNCGFLIINLLWLMLSTLPLFLPINYIQFSSSSDLFNVLFNTFDTCLRSILLMFFTGNINKKRLNSKPLHLKTWEKPKMYLYFYLISPLLWDKIKLRSLKLEVTCRWSQFGFISSAYTSSHCRKKDPSPLPSCLFDSLSFI